MPRNDMKLVPMPMLNTLLLKSDISSIGDGERISHQTNDIRETRRNRALRCKIGGEVQPMREPLETVMQEGEQNSR